MDRGHNLAISSCLITAGLVAACGPAEIVLPIPEATSALGAFVLWQTDSILAFEDFPLRLETGQDTGLILLGYDASLEELGLVAGPLAPGEMCRECSVATPEAVYQAVVRGGALASAWTKIETVPDQTLDELVPDRARCDLCRPFERVRVLADEPPSPSPGIALLTSFGGGALVAYEDGKIRAVDPRLPASEPGWSPVDLCQASPDFRLRTGYRSTDDHIVFIDAGKRISVLQLSRLRRDRPCAEALVFTSSVSSPYTIDRIAGPLEAEPSELYAISKPSNSLGEYSIVQRFAPGTGWMEIGRLDGVETTVDVAWASPGRALAVNGLTEYLRIRDGRADRHLVEVEGVPFYADSVAYLEPWGFLIGTDNSLVVKESPTGFDFLDEIAGSAQRVERMVPYERLGHRGLAIGTRDGVLRLYFEERGYCPGQFTFGASLNENEPAKQLAVTSSGDVVGGEDVPRFAIRSPDTCVAVSE